MNERYAIRREAVRRTLEKEGLDGLLVTHAANRYYLSGFELHDPQCNESAGAVLVTAEKGDWLLTDPRYEEAAKRIWDNEKIFIYRGKRNEKISEWLRDLIKGTIGFEKSSVSYDLYRALAENNTVKPFAHCVEEVRLIKDEQEVGLLRKSCALNHRAMKWIENELIQVGLTEEAMAWEIEKFFRENGASALSFSSIVAVGPNGALPHAIPGKDQVVDNCPVLIDIGCRMNDYCSDQTRTFWSGHKQPDHFRRTRDLVREAQDLAISHIHPGMDIRQAYELVMSFFKDNGVGDHFTHSLGHGIGLETHEQPSVGPMTQGVFKPGMVVTVEPGLYYPEWGGVRWEYMVVITEDGAEIL